MTKKNLLGAAPDTMRGGLNSTKPAQREEGASAYSPTGGIAPGGTVAFQGDALSRRDHRGLSPHSRGMGRSKDRSTNSIMHSLADGRDGIRDVVGHGRLPASAVVACHDCNESVGTGLPDMTREG